MPVIDFPSNPSNNELFIAQGKAMRYNSDKNKWKHVTTLTQSQVTSLENNTIGVAAMAVSGNTLVIEKDNGTHANVSLSSFSGNILTNYASASDLPLTGLVSGTQVYVEDTDSLFITDGSGWFKVATVNLAPSLALGVSSISLSSGNSVDVNFTVNEPEDTPYTITASATANVTVDVHQSNNTITLSNVVAGSAEVLTITATDGTNTVADTLAMTLVMGPWQQDVELLQTLTSPNTHLGDFFGGDMDSVSNSSLIIIGAHGSTWASTYPGLGTAYIMGQNEGTLSQVFGPLQTDVSSRRNYASHGQQVAISNNGNYAAISSSGDYVLNNAGNKVAAGSVHLYHKASGANTWNTFYRITNPNAGANDDIATNYFGSSIAMNDNHIIISARKREGESTAQATPNITIFRLGDSPYQYGQQYQTRIISPSGNGSYAGQFASGGALAAANDGTTEYFAAGEWGDYYGKVYVYSNGGSGDYSLQATIQADDYDPSNGDQRLANFGKSIAFSGNADYMIVGSPKWDDKVNSKYDIGKAYIFTRSGGTWTQQATLHADDNNADTLSKTEFGTNVEINSTGDTAIVSISRGGADNNNFSKQEVYVFTRTGTTWSRQVALSPTDVSINHDWGSSMLLTDTYNVLVGAKGAAANYVTPAGKVISYGMPKTYQSFNSNSSGHFTAGFDLSTYNRTYTYEMYARCDDNSDYKRLGGNYSGSTGRTIHGIYLNKIASFVGGVGGWYTPAGVNGTNIILPNQFYHLAWVSNPDGSTSLWLDGVFMGNQPNHHSNYSMPSMTTSVVQSGSSANVTVRSWRWNSTQLYTGTSNFTPPPVAMPNVPNTIALWNGKSNPPIDTSGNNNVFTKLNAAVTVTEYS